MEGFRKDKPGSLIRKKSGFGMTGLASLSLSYISPVIPSENEGSGFAALDQTPHTFGGSE